MLKTKNGLSVVAEKDLAAGELIIPIFCRRATSIVVEGDRHADHHKSIGVDVEWTEPNMDKAKVQTIALYIKEELRLPKTNGSKSDWTGHEDLHPFWAVRRQADGTEINCQIFRQHVELLVSMDFEAGLAKHSSKVSDVTATAMYRPIREGVEVVLLNTKPVPQEKKKRKLVDAFDHLKSKYGKTAAKQ